MLALSFDGQPQLREVPRPAPGDGEVLVRVHLAGICRTDLEILRATTVLRASWATSSWAGWPAPKLPPGWAGGWWGKSPAVVGPATSAAGAWPGTADSAGSWGSRTTTAPLPLPHPARRQPPRRAPGSPRGFCGLHRTPGRGPPGPRNRAGVARGPGPGGGGWFLGIADFLGPGPERRRHPPGRAPP